MEERTVQKRPLNRRRVHNDSLKLETLDNDFDHSPSHSPSRKKVCRSLDGMEVTGTPSMTCQQYPSAADCCSATSKATLNAEVKEEEVIGRPKHAVSGSVDINADIEVISKVTDYGDDFDSGDTLIMSDESVNSETGYLDLARAATVDQENTEKSRNTDQQPITLKTGTSLHKDANKITSIIPQADWHEVIASLEQHRLEPDRVNFVLIDILDRELAKTSGPQQYDKQRTAAVASHEQHHQLSDSHSDSNTHKEMIFHRVDSQTADSSHQCHSGPSVQEQRGVEKASSDWSVNDLQPAQQSHADRNSHDDKNSLYMDCEKVMASVRILYPEAHIDRSKVCALLQCYAHDPMRVCKVSMQLQYFLEPELYFLLKPDVKSLLNDIKLEQSTENRALQLAHPQTEGRQQQTLTEERQQPQAEGRQQQTLTEERQQPQAEGRQQQILTEERQQPQAEGRQQQILTEERQQTKILCMEEEPSASTAAVAAVKDDPLPDDCASVDALLPCDLVFQDMLTVSRLFPDRDQNQLYAMVEAHYYKPDRVQRVIEELLGSQQDSQDLSQPHPATSPSAFASDCPHPSLPEGQPPMCGAEPVVMTDDYLLQTEVDHLRDVFPDCDPNYILQRLQFHKDTADRLKIIVTEMFEDRSYPRLKDMQEKRTKDARKRRLYSLDITMQEFLAKFPDPSLTLHSTEGEMTVNYKHHLEALLKCEFADFHSSYLKSVMMRHQHHLLPCVRELENTRRMILANGGLSKKLRSKWKEVSLEYPEEPDEYFFYELWYCYNEQKVTDHLEQKAALRQVRVEEARANNELYECCCCYDDECLFEDMNTCEDGHLFCQTCIKRSVEAAFGDGKTQFPCLSGSCQHQIPLSVLKAVLSPPMFSKVLRKMQEEEVRQAGIADLVECPFCPFATIMPDSNDKVFRCLNPQCLRDSCRLCREPDHVPLHCEEVEKQAETDMRTFIEKRVTEAMLRKCHRCGKHFIKEAGCNKMTCVCGATSCYVCRAKDIDYTHFSGENCSENDTNKLHVEEMKRAAKDAREEYIRLHPAAAHITLKNNPTQHITQDPTMQPVPDDEYRQRLHNPFPVELFGMIFSDEDSVDSDFDSEDYYNGEEEEEHDGDESTSDDQWQSSGEEGQGGGEEGQGGEIFTSEEEWSDGKVFTVEGQGGEDFTGEEEGQGYFA